MSMQGYNDIELLKASINGDSNAFGTIVKKYQSLVCAITYSATADVGKSEELAQETFLNAWKNLTQLKDLNKFRSWLVSIARNINRDFFSSRKHDLITNAAQIEQVEIAEKEFEPVQAVINKEQQQLVNQALQLIPEMYREPLVLFHRQQQSIKEVAEQLEISENVVRVRIFRGREMLKEQMRVMVETTIGKTGPGKEFTAAVVAVVAGIAIKGSGVASAGIVSATEGSTSGAVTTVMSGVTAKIIAAAAVVVIAVATAVIYKQTIKPASVKFAPETANAVVAVEDRQNAASQNRPNDGFAISPTQSTLGVNKQPADDVTGNKNKSDGMSAASVLSLTNEADNKFRGVVKDRKGNAIPNASVVLYHNNNRDGYGDYVADRATTDANGIFKFRSPIEFKRVSANSNNQDSYIILAAHPDYALGWYSIKQGMEQASYEVILTEPVLHTVKITDQNSIALSGVRIWLRYVGSAKSTDILFKNSITLTIDTGLGGGITDSNGVAAIKNLPKTNWELTASTKGYAIGLVSFGKESIRLSKGANVHGFVLAEPNKPVQKAIVKFHPRWMGQFSITETDSNGSFSFEDLPGKGWNIKPLGSASNADGAYFVTFKHKDFTAPSMEVQLLPEQNINGLVIHAVEGTLIKCKVIESDTNFPMTYAGIRGSSKSGEIEEFSDSQGICTFRVAPGTVNISFNSPEDGIYVLREAMVSGSYLRRFEAQGKEMEITLKSPPIGGVLTNVTGIVVEPNGRRQQTATVYAVSVYAVSDKYFQTSTRSYLMSTQVDANGKFELWDVPAGLKMLVYAESLDRSLAGTGIFEIPIEPNESFSIEQKLYPTGKCSVLIPDQNDNLVRNTTFSIYPMVERQIVREAIRDANTNSDGLLQTDGILPGLKYQLVNKSQDGIGGTYYGGGKVRMATRRTSSSAKVQRSTFPKEMILIPLDSNEPKNDI